MTELKEKANNEPPSAIPTTSQDAERSQEQRSASGHLSLNPHHQTSPGAGE